jgi:hypothetical protein
MQQYDVHFKPIIDDPDSADLTKLAQAVTKAFKDGTTGQDSAPSSSSAGSSGSSMFTNIIAGISSVAGGIALVDALKDVANNSKILNMVTSQVAQALGLLVDLILLPFLPLIVGGIISLYLAIIGFGKAWGDAWKVIQTDGIVGLLKLGISAGLDGVEAWVQNLLTTLFTPGTPKQKALALQMTFDSILSGLFKLLGGDAIKAILDLWFGPGTLNKANNLALSIGVDFLMGVSSVLQSIMSWVFGGLSKITTLMTLKLDLQQAATGWIWDFIKMLFDGGKGLMSMLPTISLPINLIPTLGGNTTTVNNQHNNVTVNGGSSGGGSNPVLDFINFVGAGFFK